MCTVYTCLYPFNCQNINLLHPVISSQSLYFMKKKKGSSHNQQRDLRDQTTDQSPPYKCSGFKRNVQMQSFNSAFIITCRWNWLLADALLHVYNDSLSYSLTIWWHFQLKHIPYDRPVNRRQIQLSSLSNLSQVSLSDWVFDNTQYTIVTHENKHMSVISTKLMSKEAFCKVVKKKVFGVILFLYNQFFF